MLSRRAVLAGAAIGGGLVVAWAVLPRNHAHPIAPGPDEYVFGAWLKIASDGVVSIAVPQLEMGQGITTLLPQIAAMELGADWRQIAVEPVPVSGAYPNLPLAARWAQLRASVLPPVLDRKLYGSPDDVLLRRWAEANRFNATADGTSLAAYELPCREAAATARAMLAMAAADQWKVAWEECLAADGFVVHEDKRASFGELAEAAAKFSPPDPPPLRPVAPADPAPVLPAALAGAGERAIAYPRLDLPAKVDGSALFAGDVRLPDMVHAAIRHGPVDNARLSSFDREAFAETHGLLGVVHGSRWIAAVARNWWAAEKALEAAAPRFRLAGPVSSARMEEMLDAGVRRGVPQRIATRGNGDASMNTPTLALRYDVMPAAHGTIETASCTARFEGGRLELWLASQAPEQARIAAAKAVGVTAADVVLYPVLAGGSFDRRLEHDHAVEAAVIARDIGRPVQLTWSRWQEQLMLRPRPPVAAVLSAKVAPDARIETFRARLAMPSSALEFGRRLFAGRSSREAMEEVAGKPDPLALEGLMPAYSIPDVAIDHVPVSIGLPTGRLRGNAHGYTAFMVESFIDEIAVRGGKDPLAFRIAMLEQDLFLAECLSRASELAGWDKGGRGSKYSGKLGLACHRMGGAGAGQENENNAPGAVGRIALVAQVGHDEDRVRVEKLFAAVNIGRVINRDIALQQIEGGLLYGLGLAFGSGVEYQQGMPVQGSLASLRLPALADAPEIIIELMESDQSPFDGGELAVAPVAPAVANALYSATGIRQRRLPLLTVRS